MRAVISKRTFNVPQVKKRSFSQPASHQPLGFVLKVSGKSDEATRRGAQDRQPGNVVVDKDEEAIVDQVCEEMRTRATMCESSADADRERRPDTAVNSNRRDLSIA